MRILNVASKKDEAILRSKISHLDLHEENKRELRELISKMRRAMKDADGVGLSANQIGIKKRIFVAQVPDDQGKLKFYSIINPKIVKIFSNKVAMEEGCLSVPEKYGEVLRPEKIILEGETIDGKKIKIKAWGLLSRVFQHEFDHLEGKLFIDKARHLHALAKKES